MKLPGFHKASINCADDGPMHAVAITNHELRSTRLIRQIRREILSDLPIYAVAVVYAVVAGIWLGDLRALVGGGASSYGEIIGTIAISLFLPTTAAGLCIAALIADPRSPLRQIGRWLAGLNVARWSRALPFCCRPRRS